MFCMCAHVKYRECYQLHSVFKSWFVCVCVCALGYVLSPVMPACPDTSDPESLDLLQVACSLIFSACITHHHDSLLGNGLFFSWHKLN